MANTKTSALIDSCATTFKRVGLLRLAEEPAVSPAGANSRNTVAPISSEGRAYSVTASASATSSATVSSATAPQDVALGDRPQGMTHGLQSSDLQNTPVQGGVVFRGNAALDLNYETSIADRDRQDVRHGETKSSVPVGLQAVDDFLPDGGLPTGKVTELVMSGGAAWGTRLALWACRAAQEQAALTGSECWCAYIDPSGSLHARGVEATGVALSRLLVLRPTLEDVERVVLRLSEARVFSVIVVDLVGVPWAIRSARSTHKASIPGSGWSVASGRNRADRLGGSEHKRQNWPRTVRQLALRLANTRARVILLTEGQADIGGRVSGQAQHGLPLPVALRLQMSSTRSGVSLQVVKEAQGRVGRQVTIPWAQWWGKPEVDETSAGKVISRDGRAKPLGVQPERVQSLLRTVSPERQSREAGIPTVMSSRLARSSRASL